MSSAPLLEVTDLHVDYGKSRVLHGVSLTDIGLMSLLGMPWTLKVFWSPLVDRYGSFQRWILACLATSTSAIVASLAGYSFSRFRFRGRQVILVLILATIMIPGLTQLIPLYSMLASWGLLNTYLGLILIYSSGQLPFSIWIMKSFFDTIPREIEDAAMIDGCGRLGALIRVVLPMIAPGLVAAGVYTFLIAWDEYLFAATLTVKPEMRTLPPGIIQSFVGQFYLNWPNVMAASVLVTIPVTILFIFFQKHLVQGLTAGAVKG